MQTVEAVYKNGSLHLLAPLYGVTEAKLTLIILDKNDQNKTIVKSLRDELADPEQEFQLIGLTDFFATEDDKNIDWETIKESEKLALTRLQEQSGFAQTVLASPLEDVWNEL